MKMKSQFITDIQRTNSTRVRRNESIIVVQQLST